MWATSAPPQPLLVVRLVLWFVSCSNFRLNSSLVSCLHAAASLRGLGLVLLVVKLQR